MSKQIERNIYVMENFNTKILKIKDKNIKINDIVKEKKQGNKKVLVLKGILTKEIKDCKCCKSKDSIKKHGYRKTTVKLPKIMDQDVILELKKQRYKCKECKKTFTVKTSLVESHCNISNNTKIGILINIQKSLTFKYIGELYNLSSSTIIRIMKKHRKLVDNNKFTTLPEHICIDEIKTTKDAFHSMSLVYADAESHRLKDIVNGRTHYSFTKHFSKYPKKERLKVKTVCIDIYQTYMKGIKELFPNAEIIIDRFHIVQNITREFNKIRITVMNNLKNKDEKAYKVLKNNWRLLLTREDKIKYEKMYKSRIFKCHVSNKEVLEYLLKIDEQLAKEYRIMQDTVWAIYTKDKELFEDVINRKNDGYSENIKKAINTMERYKKYMLNSLKYKYSNGPLEGLNNKIKVIKRVSYGYGNFDNFRLRILFVLRSFTFNDDYKSKNILTQRNFAA